jgi:uncharacterized protein YxjI
MKFPLSLSFKVMALAPQISALDADGKLQFYVRQKLLKFKEAVEVFADEGQSRLLYTINADRVIDWSANYAIADASGKKLGVIARKGMRSLWRAEYHIQTAAGVRYVVREENPWAKVMDGLFSEIPVIGILTGYVFHPAYRITRENQDGVVMRAEKQPAFFEGKYRVEAPSKLAPDDEAVLSMGLVMLLLLERQRG